jgi:uncharacterized protein (TIGR03118 family)
MRSSLRWLLPVPLVLATLACGGAQPTSGVPQTGPSLESLSQSAEQRCATSYEVTALVADTAGAARSVDANLVNGWGLVASPTSPWWLADNGTGRSTLYDGTGTPQALVVDVPGAGGPAAPTGIVFNGGAAFLLHNGTTTAAARFLFASEDGTLSGWAGSTGAHVVVDSSAAGAVYKGLAIAATAAGDRLFATDFHNGRVDVFDGTFAPVAGPAFVDRRLPRGYAPFGIRTLGGVVYVTYARQDAARHDEVDGRGRGFVSAFDTSGKLLGRIASRGHLDAPWGLALAPANFGSAAGQLIVGNFGDGRLIAYPPFSTSTPRGEEDEREGSGGRLLRGASGPLSIDGLWGLSFGNGARAGPADRLYFAAGPGGEQHGLFGYIAAGGLVCAEEDGPDGEAAQEQ